MSTGAPEVPWGVQSGEVTSSGAVVWSRADRRSRLVVEWSASPSFRPGSRIFRVVGPEAAADTDFTAKVALGGLPAGTRIHYRAAFEGERLSEWATGSLLTAPSEDDRYGADDVVFAWSGDTNGQGWGIDPARGGMPAYAALLERAPAFFVHCGDAIYADQPIPTSIALADGTTWNNVVTSAKSRRANTLDDFRGAFLYPRHCREVRAASAAIPIFSIWDDHEVENDWWPGKSSDVDVLARHARRAMYEHAPTLRAPSAPMYRSVKWGPHLELFLLDGRSLRTPNTPMPDEGSVLFGDAQLTWLGEALARSTATWKVVASDVPIGLVVSEPDGRGGEAYDGVANGDGPPRARERELAKLLSSIKERGVGNVVWITAEVHYAAALRHDPARAAFKDFAPFWELVAGPMHAASFPEKRLDDTFGPEAVFSAAPRGAFGSPATGEQSFGVVRIDGKTGAMTVTFVDGRGRDLRVLVLRPEG